MNPQAAPNFDLLSFQRLLEAAWVLQCRQDEAPSALDHKLAPVLAAPAERSAVPDAMPVALAADLSEPSYTAEDLPSPIPEPLEILPVLEGHKRAEPFVPGAARNSHVTLGFAVMAMEPFFVLLIIFTFLLTQAWPRVDHAFAHVPEVTAPIPQPAQPSASTESNQAVPATLTESALPTTSSDAVALPSIPLVQATHKRVTDSGASATLHDLSRFEIKTLRRQAQDGDSVAAFTLAMAYESGHLVPQNCAKAATWVRKSAKEGNAAAEYNLGLRYRYGDGVRANARQARRWLQRAAAKGYPKAPAVLSASN